MSLLSLLIFIVVLGILVFVHEFGHYITARSVGVKVEKFALGFGPKLLSWEKDGTEYMLCAVPLGGYVKMAGDERSNLQGTKDEYYSQPVGHRALIVVMGPVVNYILAYLCFCVVYIIGYPTMAPKVGEVMANYPAQIAGLQKGDTIIRIEDQNIKSWEDVQHNITTLKQPSLSVEILRDGNKLQRTLTPRQEIIKNVFGQTEQIRVIGIRPQDEMVVLEFSFSEAVIKAAANLWDITHTTYKAIYRMLTGAMSAKESMTGPIGIFYIIQKASAMGFSYLLYVVGAISASLALFNLLPFPVLDGGHLLFLAIEKIRGKTLSPKIEEVIMRVGISLIICLALFVFYVDIDRFGLIGKVVGIWKQMGF